MSNSNTQYNYTPYNNNPTSTQPSSQANLVKYVKVGEVYLNGMVRLHLYSLGQVYLLSAQIDGTSYTSQVINPRYLMKGYNEVTIYFSSMLNSLRVGERVIVMLITADNDTVGIPAVVLA
ncbi:DUF973 family protein [Stygiolobus azoricus]|uniref:DUF973 family protein n=1 Tax=Stygiolobus azoricus TaxID=41675 RepID=A0A650CN33_9CREN|nr:DUF973 family protein [Stygiolobus azoricus]QGR19178.1 DUF973 family protein [Stygiolobus azoricus]